MKGSRTPRTLDSYRASATAGVEFACSHWTNSKQCSETATHILCHNGTANPSPFYCAKHALSCVAEYNTKAPQFGNEPCPHASCSADAASHNVLERWEAIALDSDEQSIYVK